MLPHSSHRLARVPCLLACGACLLWLAACGPSPDPARALQLVEEKLAAGDVPAARMLLQEAIGAAPADPRLRIALARADLAAGDANLAQGSLQRAVELGAPRSEVVRYLAEALLAQRQLDRVRETIGDLQQWPEPLHLPLALLRAEAQLQMPSFDRRILTRDFVQVHRLHAGAAAGTSADLPAIAARLEELRRHHPLVQAAYEHAECVQSPPQPPLPEYLPTADATVRVVRVGPGHALKRPSEAARVAQDGDLVEIDAGTYPSDVAVWTQSRLVLRGVNGRPHLDARGRAAADQGIWVFRGDDITVENVAFSGARSRHRNGSGIRFLGRNLTVRDSHFFDNETGVLTWKSPDGDVLIERSVFENNGAGDGLSHNIYIGQVRAFTLRFSHSRDSRVGHEVKSRARTNFILYNRLADEQDGNSSYLVDIPEGGRAFVIGNVLQKGARAENPNAIAFAAEAPQTDPQTSGLWVLNNSFYNRYLNAVFVANRSRASAVVANNLLAGAPFTVLEGAGEERHNWRQPRPVVVDAAALDFRPTADSPLIDAGAAPESLPAQPPWPEFEYVHRAAGRPRQRVGPLDIGAYEFCGW